MITQTIKKEDGFGPYLWVVLWKDKYGEQSVSIFSDWWDAKKASDNFIANGHEATIEVAVDNTQKYKAVEIISTEDPELFAWMQGVSSMAAGDFLSNLVRAVFHADGSNTRILYPALKQLQVANPKYQQSAVQL